MGEDSRGGPWGKWISSDHSRAVITFLLSLLICCCSPPFFWGGGNVPIGTTAALWGPSARIKPPPSLDSGPAQLCRILPGLRPPSASLDRLPADAPPLRNVLLLCWNHWLPTNAASKRPGTPSAIILEIIARSITAHLPLPPPFVPPLSCCLCPSSPEGHHQTC